MRFLYFTDSHIRPDSPKSRKDNFVESIKEKFIEISSIIKEQRIDYVLHGGDLFERPDIPIPLATEFIQIIQAYGVPFYMITGNHDMFAQNPNTVSRTILGLLNSVDVIHIIEKGESIILKDNYTKVMVTGTSYFYGIDKSPQNYIIEEKPEEVEFLINMVHGLVIDGSFIEGIEYTSLDKITDTKADITLLGHYHAGFRTLEKDGKYFINPGAFTRLSSSNFELMRMPKVVIIDITDKIIVKDYFLKTAKAGEDVIDTKRIREVSFKEEVFENFKHLAENSVDFEKLDINMILYDIAKAEDIDEPIRKEAIDRIGKVQLKRSEKN